MNEGACARFSVSLDVLSLDLGKGTPLHGLADSVPACLEHGRTLQQWERQVRLLVHKPRKSEPTIRTVRLFSKDIGQVRTFTDESKQQLEVAEHGNNVAQPHGAKISERYSLPSVLATDIGQ